MRRPTRRTVIAVTSGACVAAALTTWAVTELADAQGHQPPPPVSKIDTEERVCVLVGHGADAHVAAATWAGARQAARDSSNVIAQLYPAPKAVAPAAFLNTLAHMRCGVIAAVGDSLSTAVEQAANRSPEVSYILVGTQPTPHTGLTSISTAHATSARVESTIRADL